VQLKYTQPDPRLSSCSQVGLVGRKNPGSVSESAMRETRVGPRHRSTKAVAFDFVHYRSSSGLLQRTLDVYEMDSHPGGVDLNGDVNSNPEAVPESAGRCDPQAGQDRQALSGQGKTVVSQ